MGDGTRFVQETSVTHQYAQGGVYNILGVVKHGFTTCSGTFYDTTLVQIRVEPHLTIALYDSVCPGYYSRWGFEFMMATQDTVAVDSATALANCSVAILHLKIHPTYQHFDTVVVCEGRFPYTHGGKIFDAPGDYVLNLNSVNNCDSTVMLHIIFQETVEYYYKDTICHGKNYDVSGIFIPQHEIENPGDYHFDILTSHVNNCDTIVHLHLVVYDLSVVLENQTEDFCEEYKAVLMANTNYPDIRKLKWSTGSTDEIIEVDKPGDYWVKASIGNCHVTDKININKCEQLFYVPNTFTPSNSDGTNDLFFISCRNNILLKSFEIHIYNRFGARIFYSNDIHFTWDGKYQGVLHGNTVYTYVIYYQPEGKRTLYQTGKIIVL